MPGLPFLRGLVLARLQGPLSRPFLPPFLQEMPIADSGNVPPWNSARCLSTSVKTQTPAVTQTAVRQYRMHMEPNSEQRSTSPLYEECVSVFDLTSSGQRSGQRVC